MPHMFIFGMGYSASALAAELKDDGWRISASARTTETFADLEAEKIAAYFFDGSEAAPQRAFRGVTHVLTSLPPDADGDPVLRHHRDILAAHSDTITWAGYLSTTGVYGDHGGAWVDETTDLVPVSARAGRRVAAEREWLALGAEAGIAVQLFRLGGIYGPGRNQLEAVRAGTARRIVKPGQVFGRIHVDDIVAVLRASIARPNPGQAYNVVDDEPAPPQDVIAYAAELLGVEPPPEVAFEDAELSEMGRSFYGENKRVKNERIKKELGVTLQYPTYREGLTALNQLPWTAPLSGTRKPG